MTIMMGHGVDGCDNVARSGFSEDQSSYLSRGQACRERGDTKDVTERWVSYVLY